MDLRIIRIACIVSKTISEVWDISKMLGDTGFPTNIHSPCTIIFTSKRSRHRLIYPVHWNDEPMMTQINRTHLLTTTGLNA